MAQKKGRSRAECGNAPNVDTLGSEKGHHNGTNNTRLSVIEKRNEYIYTDESGSPLFRVRRRPDKSFLQDRWTGDAWETGLDGTHRVLYRLPKVIAALNEGKPLYIAEGEKDVQALEEAGVVATTSPGGAGKWTESLIAKLSLAGATCFVIWDRDEVGKRHGLDVAASLKRAGAKVRMLRAKEGKDAADHLNAGLGIDELVARKPRERRRDTPRADREDAGSDAFWTIYRALWQYAQSNGLTRPGAPTPSGDGFPSFTACCPAHDDKQPSLSVSVGRERPVVVKCHAGCSAQAITEALSIPFELLSRSHDERNFSSAVEKRAADMRVQRAAQQIIAAEGHRRFDLPALGRTLADDLAEPRSEQTYTIEGLHPRGGNSLLVAQFKTGKTTVLMNLVRALADQVKFLDRFDVAPVEGRISYWNYELNPDQFRNWVADLEIEHADRVAAPFHLRGSSLPLWLDPVAEEVVDWLKRNEIQFLVIDPAAQAWRGMVDSENDNTKVGEFLGVLDEIKLRADVPDLVLATHMGRGKSDEGAERSRGATRLEDWMDAGWYLTKERDSERRTLWAKGRDVAVDAIDLHYDNPTRRLTFTGQTTSDRRDQTGQHHVVDALARLRERGHYPCNTNTLTDEMHGDGKSKNESVRKAEADGLISRTKSGQSLVCELTKKGEDLVKRRVRRGGSGG